MGTGTAPLPGGGVPRGRRPEQALPSTTAVDRRFTPSPGTQGRTDKNLCRCFGAPARRVFPDHLITYVESPRLHLTSVCSTPYT